MRIERALGTVAIAAAVAIGVLGCAAQPSRVDAATPAPTRVAEPTASVTSEPTPEAITFASVVDGDTIDTSAGTVRIIGIDTPERGECGDEQASAAIASALTAGDEVTLQLPAGENDHDQYGRMIRYVTTEAGLDLGLMQLQAGNAVARYDSHDGYPAHPREADYHAAQLATLDSSGAVVTVACQAAVAPAEPVAPAPPATTDRWWEKYTSCAKLKKNTVGDPTGPFNRDDPSQAEQYDWFENGTGNHGDGDGDGLACE